MDIPRISIRARYDVAREVRQFAQLILHGSDEHRAWLRDAAEQYIVHGTVPPPRDSNDAVLD